MKRALSAIMATIFLFALLASCSSQSPSGSPGTSTETASAPAPTQGDTAAPADGKVYTMRLGAISTAPTPEAVFIEELEAYIEEATNGRIDVEAYPSGTIGTTTQMIQGLQDGSVQGVCVPINYYESYVPELGILGLPMFFKDAEQAYKFCSTPGTDFHETLDTLLEAKGFVVGTWGISASSTLISTKPVAKFEDFNGLKVWCLPNKQIVAAMTALNAAPVNFDTGDLAVGIQQKTVDAAYTGAQLLAPLKLQETAKNLFILSTPMNFNVQALMCSKIFIDSLPADLAELLIQTIEKGGKEIHYPMAVATIEKSLKALMEAEGMTVVYSDDEFTAKAKEAFKPLADEFLSKVPTAKPIYDMAVQMIAEDK